MLNIRTIICRYLLPTFLFTLFSIEAATASLDFPLRSFALSTEFESLGKNISSQKLLSIADKKRAEFPTRVTHDQLLEISDAITQYMREQGYKFHYAQLPAQEIDGGSVTFNIHQVTLGDINVIHKNAKTRHLISGQFSALKNTPLYQPNIDQLILKLKHISQSQLFAYYSRGSTPNSVRLNIKITQDKALKTHSFLDNYGAKNTGTNRFQSHISWINPSHAFDTLSGGIVSALSENNQYGYLRYIRPFGDLNNQLSLSISNNVFELGGEFAALDLEGNAKITRLKLQRIYHHTRHTFGQLEVSYETKSSTFSRASDRARSGDTESQAAPLLRDIQSSSTGLRWHIQQRKRPTLANALSISLHHINLDTEGLGARDFQMFKYIYSLSYSPKSLLASHFSSEIKLQWRGQWSEQQTSSFDRVSLTGAYAVRSLDTAQYSTDNGNILSLNWRLPKLMSRQNTQWQWTPYFGIDYAQGEVKTSQHRTQDRANLAGAILGIELAWRKEIVIKLLGSTTLLDETKSELRFKQSHALMELGYTW